MVNAQEELKETEQDRKKYYFDRSTQALSDLEGGALVWVKPTKEKQWKRGKVMKM